jgi:hypothetical protein
MSAKTKKTLDSNSNDKNSAFVFVQEHPSWIKKISPATLANKDFARIIQFYLFCCPCESSAMSVTLAEYGWSNPWVKPYYLTQQLKDASTNLNSYYPANTYDDMKQALEKAGFLNDFPNTLSKEAASFYDSQNNQTLSLLKHIRNAFAHGRFALFNVNGDVFAFEDKNSSGKISSRIIIKMSTLLKWIEIIEDGEKEWVKLKV